MKDILGLINKPEYIRQPLACFRRLFTRPSALGCLKVVRLHWGLPLEVDTREYIGWLVSCSGVFEIAVVEAVFRLTDPADIFLDFGANIGYMSSVAVAIGAKTFSFEPHPDIFRQLKQNISLWGNSKAQFSNNIAAYNVAISDKMGVATLRIPQHDFLANHGLSTLESAPDDNDHIEVKVQTITLKHVIEQCGESVGVLKIDIEGHELKALTGGVESLRAGKVRDIIYEDHYGAHSPVSQLLASLGYSIFFLEVTLLGPRILAREASTGRHLECKAVNFLATLDPGRAQRRMARRGFMCLRKMVLNRG